jgi:hypothetical protein
MGIGDPDPVVEARAWVASLGHVAYAVLTYAGEVHYRTTGARKAVLAEAWEPGMARAVVIAREYEPVPGADSEAGAPLVRPIGLQLEVGTTAPAWGVRP